MEMTALAGVMGRHYALAEGLPHDIAEAIFESVLPRQASKQAYVKGVVVDLIGILPAS